MRGVTNNEDNIVINIKLKQGKKRFWFGEVNAGAGDNEKYTAKPKLFYYSPEKSVNLLADFNNIGEAPFTQGFSQELSPGNIGQWIGWQIIKKYVSKNPEMKPEELMRTDAKKIIDEAKYKPK